jgi:hypothetical protein
VDLTPTKDVIEDDDFLPIPRIARTIPFGYKKILKITDMLLPVPRELRALEKAKEYLKQYSYREVANWLTKQTGRSISHMGLKKRIDSEQSHKRRSATLREWARRYETAISKAETLERSRLGARKSRIDSEEEQTQPKIEVKEDPQAPEFEPIRPEEEHNVIFKPNAGPQTEFLAAGEREVLYGGAAGGGKSYAMLADPLRFMGHPSFSGLLLRHTNEELRELVWKSQEMYPKIWPGIKWSERKMQWTAPSGARLWFSYLDRDDDVLRYQGQAFSWIGFDELTQWHTPFAWDYMRSRLRSTAPDLPVYMRATTNPGGPGHAWVKKMFIDPSPPGSAFNATDIESGKTLAYPKGHSKKAKHCLNVGLYLQC